MAIQLVRDAKLWVHGYDLSGDMNSISFDISADELDGTTLGATARQRVPGLMSTSFAHEGYWQAGAGLVDEVLFNRFGLNNTAMSVGVQTGADGEPAYLSRMLQTVYSPGATIGEIFAFSVSGSGNGQAVRGTIMHNATRTTTGTGTARQLGAVAAGQKLYATLHVIAASAGDTIDVVVRSDDNGAMSSPINRITFAQVGATVSGEYATPVVGPITDDWWQVSWTIGGASPSYTFIVVVGIR